MGRRCLGFGKKKRNRVEMERKRSRVDDDRNNSRGKMRVEEEEMWGFSRVFGEKENFYDNDEEGEMGNFSARFEAEKVWLELYQIPSSTTAMAAAKTRRSHFVFPWLEREKVKRGQVVSQLSFFVRF
ncbi:hypothetical protein Godav_014928 [Gossypium davidsonii]|uniref:Uncharacterized protein n=1 Tax=Gossypium davidsonii TaxID=34287 RepID=A0A7J8RMT0_GOSDV|nr:hypothetical protein [Gossypium davidsonii]